MKNIPFIQTLLLTSIFEAIYSRPIDEEKETKELSMYVVGNLANAAVSHGFSKSQAASDRNESEWNSTEMMNGGSSSSSQYDEDYRRAQRILIYAGGDASNIAVSYEASEAQAAENDQKSGYNNQNLGLNHAFEEEEEYDESVSK